MEELAGEHDGLPGPTWQGSVSDVAFYPQAITAAAIAQQYALGEAASPELTQVTLPSGEIFEQASLRHLFTTASPLTPTSTAAPTR